MRPMRRTLRVCLTLIACLFASDPAAQQPPAVAIEGVTVIPMDRERVIADQTVIVQDGRITAVGARASAAVPAGATRVDGRGRFLMPALAEMHAHIPGGNQTAQAERVLFMYVANGIGTIRSMLGDPGHFALRDRASRGQIVAPSVMILSGPSFNGQTAATPQGASARVSEQKKAGYDLLKIHPGVPRVAFDAMAATADTERIRFAGHVPADVGLARALEAKFWTIDHLDGYVEAIARPGTPPGSQLFGVGLVGQLDESRIPSIVAQTKAAGTAMVPTQVLLESWYGADDPEAMRQWPEMRYASRAELDQWVATKLKNIAAFSLDHRQRFVTVRRRVLKALHDGGVPVLLGSDAPQTWNVPGFSVHRELAAYVAAGLTPYQALATGTRNVAVHLGTLDRSGTIATGKRADLVLVDGNPLQDIANTSRIGGVMIAGRWLPKADIDRRLAEGR
jgi:hypothetical protein